jgi:integrase
MSITPRKLASGKTVYDVRLRTPAGRPYKRTYTTKRQAEAFEAGERVDRARGSWVDPQAGTILLSAYTRQWMMQRPDLRPRTREMYEILLRVHILPGLGEAELRSLTPAGIRAWHAGLLSAGRPGPNTVAKCYRLLRTILGTAVEDELLVKNPCVIKRAGVEHTLERPVASIAEINAIANTVDPRYRAMILLAAWTGLRLGELAGLACRHLDLSNGTVRVDRQVQELNDGTVTFAPPKTEAGRRSVAVPPHLLPLLEEHLTNWAQPGSEGLVFPAAEGGPIRRSNFNRRIWSTAVRQLGLTHLRFHDLRHTGNTLAASTGASTKELMARMGHASPRAALIYQHSSIDRDKAIAAALSALAEAPGSSESAPGATSAT